MRDCLELLVLLTLVSYASVPWSKGYNVMWWMRSNFGPYQSWLPSPEEFNSSHLGPTYKDQTWLWLFSDCWQRNPPHRDAWEPGRRVPPQGLGAAALEAEPLLLDCPRRQRHVELQTSRLVSGKHWNATNLTGDSSHNASKIGKVIFNNDDWLKLFNFKSSCCWNHVNCQRFYHDRA